jgi:hypothetical protein
VLPLEDDVLVDLVGDRDQVVLDARVGDQLELRAREDLARRVVRRVEQQDPRPPRDRRLQRLGVDRPARWGERDGPPPRARHRDPGRVGVVVGLEAHDVVARLADAQQRRGDRLRGAEGHLHLRLRVELDPVEPALVAGDRLAQRRHARQRRVLVAAVADRRARGLEQRLRAVLVREALAEVDRARALGER